MISRKKIAIAWLKEATCCKLREKLILRKKCALNFFCSALLFYFPKYKCFQMNPVLDRTKENFDSHAPWSLLLCTTWTLMGPFLPSYLLFYFNVIERFHELLQEDVNFEHQKYLASPYFTNNIMYESIFSAINKGNFV